MSPDGHPAIIVVVLGLGILVLTATLLVNLRDGAELERRQVELIQSLRVLELRLTDQVERLEALLLAAAER